MSASAFAAEITAIDGELKNMRGRAKMLRAQRSIAAKPLATFMIQNGFEEYAGVKLSKIVQKPFQPRKKPSEKKRDALELYRAVGIPDPASFWLQHQATQKLPARR